jgi:hypothetical protein
MAVNSAMVSQLQQRPQAAAAAAAAMAALLPALLGAALLASLPVCWVGRACAPCTAQGACSRTSLQVGRLRGSCQERCDTPSCCSGRPAFMLPQQAVSGVDL